MYIITFYSFKGGVGRTMALANVALELVREGRRVLLVDFDLEAPGLDTFQILKPATPSRGIVDFVSEYYRNGIAPAVTDFVYQPVLRQDFVGSLFVMPTGAQDHGYGPRLNSIDWQELYLERDGYVLFEDLKEQWHRLIQPDYVLIDSRTGHTDVGGICTRQLPDAVAVLFFPNEQNLRGLDSVVNDVRADSSRTSNPIRLYFVASNIPDLDDEDDIIRGRLNDFREKLHYEELDATIHHYDSLALLEQTVFTLERPKTKLAREYRQLAHRLTSRNFQDRMVALSVLNELAEGRFFRRRQDPKEADDLLKSISLLYGDDGEVLYHLARANRYLGRDEAAERFIAEAQKLGYETAETLVARAKQAYNENLVDRARTQVEDALTKPHERLFTRERVVELVSKHDPGYLLKLASTLIERGLNPFDGLHLGTQFMRSIAGVAAAETLLRHALTQGNAHDPGLRSAIERRLSLCLIAEGRFAEAKVLIAPERSQLAVKGIPDVFNYAMAEWGASRKIPQDLFSRLLEMNVLNPPHSRDPNYCQCIALASWAVGDCSFAKELVPLARTALGRTEWVFSAWRYLEVSAPDFLQDLDALEHLIDTGEGIPSVYARAYSMPR